MAKATKSSKKNAVKKAAKKKTVKENGGLDEKDNHPIAILLAAAKKKLKSDEVKRIVLRKKTVTLNPDIEKFNNALQTDKRLKAFKGYEFQGFESAPGVAFHALMAFCCPDDTRPCGHYPDC